MRLVIIGTKKRIAVCFAVKWAKNFVFGANVSLSKNACGLGVSDSICEHIVAKASAVLEQFVKREFVAVHVLPNNVTTQPVGVVSICVHETSVVCVKSASKIRLSSVCRACMNLNLANFSLASPRPKMSFSV